MLGDQKSKRKKVGRKCFMLFLKDKKFFFICMHCACLSRKGLDMSADRYEFCYLENLSFVLEKAILTE